MITVNNLTRNSTLSLTTMATALALAGFANHVNAGTVTPTASGIGNIYFVDSRFGSDENDGLQQAYTAYKRGPWKSLAKLSAFPLKPGDSVNLLCGSKWNETLKISSLGTSANPISIGAYPATCATKPEINGSYSYDPSKWVWHSGNIYKIATDQAPEQLFSTSGYMTIAHHPNRGYDASAPNSLYARLAADSNRVISGSRSGSSFVTIGSDLKLPAGVSIDQSAFIRIRTNAWVIDESQITAFDGKTITLSSLTRYPLTAGWGYYLTNQAWMLDSPGEWFYDKATKTLFAWMSDSRPPTINVAATVLKAGIDLSSSQYISVSGINVKRTVIGMDLRRSVGATVRNSSIEETSDVGINAVTSTTLSLTSNRIIRTGKDAISGQDDIAPTASKMTVSGNFIKDSGVAMNGEEILSLPVRNRAAINAGTSGIIINNTIVNSGYIGIEVGANSNVSKNVISGSCTVLDDCGAIYGVGANNNSTISDNIILGSRGAVDGKSPEFNYTQAQGIFLDEFSSGVTVSGNTITAADNGIQLHDASKNSVIVNKLYGNRRNQMWLQESRNKFNLRGDLFGNVFRGNHIVSTTGDAKSLYLDTRILDSAQFGTFDQNRYLDNVYPIVSVDRNLTAQQAYTFAAWKAAATAGIPRQLDGSGFATSQTQLASILVNGENVVPNANAAANAEGWSSWNQIKPFGQLIREACVPGICMRYVAGTSVGLMSSPNFTIEAGNWYRLSLDIATGKDGQIADLLVRRGGGGNNGYEQLSDRALKFTASSRWARYSVLFKATKTVMASDPITQDLGARIDFQNIQPGQVLSISNLELVPITPADALARSDLLVNTGTAPIQVSCPSASINPAACNTYVSLSDNQPVSWPRYLLARSSEIVYTRDARLVDSDGDGIPDGQDQCPTTPAGSGVNRRGCGLGEK